MNKKQFIIEQLKNWYVIDNILLECDPKKCIKNTKLYNEYNTIKSSLLMTLHEFYLHKKIKTLKEKVTDSKILQENANEYAKEIKKITSHMLNSPKIKEEMTKTVMMESKQFKNSELSTVTSVIVNKKFLTLALENALIGKPLLENHIESLPQLSDMKGCIIYESYKIQRDALVNLALKIRHAK